MITPVYIGPAGPGETALGLGSKAHSASHSHTYSHKPGAQRRQLPLQAPNALRTAHSAGANQQRTGRSPAEFIRIGPTYWRTALRGASQLTNTQRAARAAPPAQQGHAHRARARGAFPDRGP